ncbi:MFS transporter [Candidatus Halobonum tyrrellensis]|uniref:Major facilitator superfamily MFS_1 n=1 Tax=Candidatus Halobonum tyrrellensis G22 TaxID=1324957 RepID=V4HJD2_9EURY|nr:MFS transporter [Candidatus Halobonum tyrrellensis]ESP88029.1 major facilitator superfamily MFS_1 [Candidatus Halobonum tyrrellensis G22]
MDLRTLVGADAAVLADRDFRVILLASVCSPLGASVVSPLLNTLTGPFGVSGARVGLLMSAFTAPAVVCIPLVGAVSDRYGRKPVLTAGLALFGLTGMAVGLTTDFRVALALRLLQGIGYTGIGPVLVTITGDLFDGPAEATAQGLRFTTVGVSLTVFPLVSGALVALAWQFPFALYAVTLPTALAVWLLFHESGEPGSADEGADVRALLTLASRPRVAATLAGRAVPSFLWYAFLTYNSFVVVEVLGGSPGEAGALVAVASVASAVATTQTGRATAALGTRVPLVGALAAGGVGLAGVALAPSLPVAFAAGALVGMGFSVSLTLYRSAITGQADAELRGGLVSLGETAGRAGSTVAPAAMGAAVALLSTGGTDAGAVRVVVVAVAVGAAVAGGLLLLVGGGPDGGGERSDG